MGYDLTDGRQLRRNRRQLRPGFSYDKKQARAVNNGGRSVDGCCSASSLREEQRKASFFSWPSTARQKSPLAPTGTAPTKMDMWNKLHGFVRRSKAILPVSTLCCSKCSKTTAGTKKKKKRPRRLYYGGVLQSCRNTVSEPLSSCSCGTLHWQWDVL